MPSTTSASKRRRRSRPRLRDRHWDLVISDYSLPGLDARAAIQMFKQEGPDIPFLVVSGAVGEETAVEVLSREPMTCSSRATWRVLSPRSSGRSAKQASAGRGAKPKKAWPPARRNFAA